MVTFKDKELEKAAIEFEKLKGHKIFLEEEDRIKQCKHLCIESFKAGANYSNSINPSYISNGLDCKMIAIDEELCNVVTSSIDWEQRRYEIAKAILTGYSSGEGFYSGIDRPKEHCERAIMYADELIRQLKQ